MKRADPAMPTPEAETAAKTSAEERPKKWLKGMLRLKSSNDFTAAIQESESQAAEGLTVDSSIKIPQKDEVKETETKTKSDVGPIVAETPTDEEKREWIVKSNNKNLRCKLV